MATKRINQQLKLIGVALLAYCIEAYKLDESLVRIPSKKHISFHAKGMYNGTLTHLGSYIKYYKLMDVIRCQCISILHFR